MRRYVTLRDFYSNKSGQHCARAWASTTILRPTCARANVISITNKLNTAPRAGCRRAEHRTLLATCVKLKGGREGGRDAGTRAREDEQRRIHENTPGVFHQFSLDLPRYVLWHVFLWPRILYSWIIFSHFFSVFLYLYPPIYRYMIFSHKFLFSFHLYIFLE